MTKFIAARRSFDCLKFKDAVQREVAKETAGMTPQQYKEYLHASAESGPLSDFYRKVIEANKPRKRQRNAR